MIITGAILAAIAAKVLIPALIALGLLGGGFAGGYYYQLHVIAQQEQTIRMELERLRQEAAHRHTLIQQSANHLAQRTEHHVEATIRRNHTQHIQIAKNMTELTTQTDQIQDSAHSLESVSSVLTNLTDSTSENMTEISQEFTQLQTELTGINLQLKATQAALAAKELLLQDALNHLLSTQIIINNESKTNATKVTELSQQLHHALRLLNTPSNELEIRETEISALKVDNKKMAATIVKLEATINQFILKIRELKQTNTSQKTEFQKLISENKQLDITVRDLSNKIPVDAPHQSGHSGNRYAQTLGSVL